MIINNQHCHFNDHDKKMTVVNTSSGTILGTVYKLCLICMIETLKLIGETLHHQKEPNKEQQQRRKKCGSPPVPRRTHSRVIKVNNNGTKTTITTHSSGARAFGRSLHLNRHYLLPRRHSNPLYRSKLAIVMEEDPGEMLKHM